MTLKKLPKREFFNERICLAYFISEPDSERITDISDNDQAHDDTNNCHLSKSFYETDTHPPEDKSNKQSCDVAIPDSSPCFTETELERSFHIFTVFEKVSDTFEEEDI